MVAQGRLVVGPRSGRGVLIRRLTGKGTRRSGVGSTRVEKVPQLKEVIDRIGMREREGLASLHRYFVWADHRRLQYRKLLWETPLGRLKRAGASEAQALEQGREPTGDRII